MPSRVVVALATAAAIALTLYEAYSLWEIFLGNIPRTIETGLEELLVFFAILGLFVYAERNWWVWSSPQPPSD